MGTYKEKFYNEKWYEELSVNELADMLKHVLSSSNGYANMLSIDKKIRIVGGAG